MPWRVHNDWTLKLFIYDTIVSMDYFIGFLIGYYIRLFFNFLKELSVVKLPDNYVKEDWDWLSTDEPQ